jgi:hypothetical protein
MKRITLAFGMFFLAGIGLLREAQAERGYTCFRNPTTDRTIYFVVTFATGGNSNFVLGRNTD